ncbi:hypothetical protein OOT46_29435 [Aquabacterium sp. A7-Y]|uniref:hypothetical protein n=1 Tax=Aquabacterium sp. A7-Y TaxID=1349605 RepID=UPI00223D56B6|nr:hypothetical protein [Aquabacterium sp. A7-Y]MCW7541925.1 hypothetical protein [Aquabacterium sp. A7-Y]
MGIQYLPDHAVLDATVGVEDAEALAQHLRGLPRPAVHLSDCEHLHAAALQVLLALRPRVLSLPRERWLAAALAGLEGAPA